MTDEVVWYEKLRQTYRPPVARVLLIGESPPDPRDAERRYFYTPVLSKHDNLYRGVSTAFYGESTSFDVRAKVANLNRLRDDGVWLVDAVERPVNARTKSKRRRAIHENLDGLVARCSAIGPTLGVIVCHGPVYEAAARGLRAAGIRVLHDVSLPFPLGNTRAAFVRGVRTALADAGWASSDP